MRGVWPYHLAPVASAPNMKAVVFSWVIVFLASSLAAENQTVQAPITMEQLMRELRIQGGNWIFRFERPVYAKVVCTVSAFPDGKTSQVTAFISDQPESEISLFFMASPLRVGDYPRPDQQNECSMKVKLSACKATDGTRIIHYVDKFSTRPWMQQKGEEGRYKPSLPLHPELNKEYILH